MSGQDETVTPPTPAVLQRHALRVAIKTGQADQAERAKEGARAAAQIVFAAARRKADKTLAVILPDGTEIGTISIHKGTTTFTVDEDSLLAIAAGNDSGDLEDYLLPGADRDSRPGSRIWSAPGSSPVCGPSIRPSWRRTTGRSPAGAAGNASKSLW